MADRYWVGGQGFWGQGGNIISYNWSNRSDGPGGFTPPGPGDNAIIQSYSANGNAKVTLLDDVTVYRININAPSFNFGGHTLRCQTGYFNASSDDVLNFPPGSELLCIPEGTIANAGGPQFSYPGLTCYIEQDTFVLGTPTIVYDTSLLEANALVSFQCTTPNAVPILRGNTLGNVRIGGLMDSLDFSEYIAANLQVSVGVRSFTSRADFPGNIIGDISFGYLGDGSLSASGVVFNPKVYVNSGNTLNVNSDLDNGGFSNTNVAFDPYVSHFSFIVDGATLNLNTHTINCNYISVSNNGSLSMASANVNILRSGTVTIYTGSTLSVDPQFNYYLLNPYDSSGMDFRFTDLYGVDVNRVPSVTLYGNSSLRDSGSFTMTSTNVSTFFGGVRNIVTDQSFNGNIRAGRDDAQTIVLGNIYFDHELGPNTVYGRVTGNYRFQSSIPGMIQYLSFANSKIGEAGGIGIDSTGDLSVIGGFSCGGNVTQYRGNLWLDRTRGNVTAGRYIAPRKLDDALRFFDLGSANLTLIGTGKVWESWETVNYLMTGPDSNFYISPRVIDSVTPLVVNIETGDTVAFGNIIIKPANSTYLPAVKVTFNGNMTVVGKIGVDESDRVLDYLDLKFTSGTNTIINGWNIVNSAKRQLWSLTSNGTGQHFIDLQSGGVASDGMRISRSHVTCSYSPDIWFAGNTSVNDGENTGWIFANIPPPPGSSSGSFFTSVFFGC